MNSDEGEYEREKQSAETPQRESASQPEHRGDGKEQGAQQGRAASSHAPRRSVLEWLRRWNEWERDDVEVFFSGVVALAAVVGIVGLLVNYVFTRESLSQARIATNASERATRTRFGARLGPVDSDAYTNVREGRWRLVVFGRIEYRDTFGDDHHTDFSFVWDGFKEGKSTAEDFHIHPDGYTDAS